MNQQDPQITITLPLGAINVILGGLGELPLKHSGALSAEIQRQAQTQLQPPAAAEAGIPAAP